MNMAGQALTGSVLQALHCWELNYTRQVRLKRQKNISRNISGCPRQKEKEWKRMDEVRITIRYMEPQDTEKVAYIEKIISLNHGRSLNSQRLYRMINIFIL